MPRLSSLADERLTPRPPPASARRSLAARSCNTEMVGLFKVSDSAADMAELRGYIEVHVEKTGSYRAKELLMDWEGSAAKFVKVRLA